jgi:2-keto-3-deoxy-L-rhamnonate aldolase RhmA
MNRTTNTVLEKLRAGEVVLGLSVRMVRSGEIAKIAKACDHDWVFIDIEISIAALDSGVTPIVRVPGHEAFHISRVLDGGAMGVVVPHVNTAAEAKHAVDACRYPPVGHRSVMGGYAQLGYEGVPIKEAAEFMNANTLLAVMIETPEAVENVEEIAAVDGIDIIYIGSNDLLAEMGMPGQFESAELENAARRVIGAALSNGKFAGVGGIRGAEMAKKYVGLGSQFLTTHSDLAFMMEAASARAKLLREAAAKAKG